MREEQVSILPCCFQAVSKHFQVLTGHLNRTATGPTSLPRRSLEHPGKRRQCLCDSPPLPGAEVAQTLRVMCMALRQDFIPMKEILV